MTFKDLLAISSGNLWRMKLRTFLTVAGVVIAIAAFVAMLSFGAGNQRLITEQFNELGLFSTMYVYPPDEDEPNDSLPEAVLDQQAVETLAHIPGVNLAYPLQAFSVTASVLDTQIVTKAQALPGKAVQTKIFSRLVAGEAYGSDSANEALVSENFLEAIGIEQADSAIGMEVIVSVEVASIDSGLTRVIQGVGERIGERVRDFRTDSLQTTEYWQSG